MYHGAKDAIIRAPQPPKTPTETPSKPTKLGTSSSRRVITGEYDEKEDADWRPVHFSRIGKDYDGLVISGTPQAFEDCQNLSKKEHIDI